ncbi:unnamed protein product, partial [Prorocentrum cordatum]
QVRCKSQHCDAPAAALDVERRTQATAAALGARAVAEAMAAASLRQPRARAAPTSARPFVPDTLVEQFGARMVVRIGEGSEDVEEA